MWLNQNSIAGQMERTVRALMIRECLSVIVTWNFFEPDGDLSLDQLKWLVHLERDFCLLPAFS